MFSILLECAAMHEDFAPVPTNATGDVINGIPGMVLKYTVLCQQCSTARDDLRILAAKVRASENQGSAFRAH
jgi:hypothetical protein